MGRKKMKTVHKFDIRLRVDEALHERIAKDAEEESLPVAAWLRTAAIEKLKRKEKEAT
jgi:predicted HicB family RNase H-like nuclease